jgi:phosphatidylinositol alpha-1,6-mannosyltransferase
VMLGEGRHRDAMQVLARQLHVDDAVHFAGCLPPGGPILSFLDDIDLFLIASRAEAMPRALIEAMARGCPAVGTNIAGIPELLPPECLVMPDDVDGLAILIREILLDTEKCKHLATRNRDVAWQFRKSRLLDTLHTFHGAVRDLSTTDSDLSSSEAKSRHNGRRVAAQSINLTTGSRRH